MKVKRSLMVAAAVASVAAGGLGTAGLVAADSSSSSGTSLVSKIATKFGLKEADVQAVFDADRQEHDAQRAADQKQKLADAVTAGKLTQAQADYITKAIAEIDSLRGTTGPQDESSTVRDQIKTKMDALRTWADDNNVDMQYVMMGHGGHGGPDGPGGPGGKPSTSTSSSSTSTSNN